MKKVSLVLFLSLMLFSPIIGQSAQMIEEITASEKLLKGQACYLVGTAARKIEDTASIIEAFNQFLNLKMFKKAKIEENIRLDEFANLALQGLDTKGGLWFRVAKNPYYAFRQLKIMGIIPQHKAPSSSIKPTEALKIINLLMEGDSRDSLTNAARNN